MLRRVRVGACLALASLASALTTVCVEGDTRADDAGASGAPGAQGSPRAPRAAVVVAVVGIAPASRSIAASDLEDRIASMPRFQRASFGPTADAIRRHVLDEVLVREALLSLAADGSKVAGDPAVSHAIERAQSSATVRAIRSGLGAAADIAMDDVRAYYERNRTRYDAPERYRISRILCKTRDEAQEVLAAAQAAALADATARNFAQLARDHSQDKATALRSGDLGFLNADGESTEPGLRVDAAVVRAAQGVRDGEFVPAPVAEGDFFSVVWRRGTLAAQKRAVGDVAPQIRAILSQARVKEETDRLVASLRAAKVRDLHEELLDGLDLSTAPAIAPDAGR
jgi:peptidyl-prolyl cis-trans isomerase C